MTRTVAFTARITSYNVCYTKLLRLRAFGIYSFSVEDPGKFMKEVFGTNSMYTVDDVTGQLKRSIVSGISDMLGESNIPAMDLAANYDA